ncbi:MAG: hypothetical protein V1824_01080 [archaeon]
MELKKTSFPVNIKYKDALKFLNKAFKKKEHTVELKEENLYLTVTPYLFCFYDIDINKDGNYKHLSGQIAINLLTNKIREDVTKLFDYDKPQYYEKLEVDTTKHIQIKIKKNVVKKEEAKNTIIKMLSCKYAVPKENITLSGVEEIAIPFWKYEHDNQLFEIDAVIGKLNNFDIIEQRQKTWLELFAEVIDDIKTNPIKIFEYIKDMLVFIWQGFVWLGKTAMKYLALTLTILLIIVVWVLFF